MADEPNRSIWESIRLWLTAVAIPVVLAVAGFWQFYLKEVLWPGAAINLTADVTVKEAGPSARAVAEARNLEAIELVITARNTSSSIVYLCTNYWAAWGITISASKQGDEKSEDWLENVTTAINGRNPLIVGKHYGSAQKTLVSAGNIFTDVFLRPSEKISATFVFYVPHDFYDLVEVHVELPTTSRGSPAQKIGPALKVNYELNPDRSDFSVASIERITSNGSTQELPHDQYWNLNRSDVTYYGWQGAGSTVDLSLRQSTPSPHTTTERPETSSSRIR